MIVHTIVGFKALKYFVTVCYLQLVTPFIYIYIHTEVHTHSVCIPVLSAELIEEFNVSY